MAMIPDDEIERIKRDTDLATVVRSRGFALATQGGDLVGLCPFHDDKTSSLHVTPAKRLWRCVSCQAMGNVIQFVQRFDGVSFLHAYELLKNGAVFVGVPTCAPVKKTTVPKLSALVTADADDQAALRQVLDYLRGLRVRAGGGRGGSVDAGPWTRCLLGGWIACHPWPSGGGKGWR